MKRLIAIALICLFGFTFGCGGASEPAPASADEAEVSADEAAPMEEAPAEEEAPMEEAAEEPAAEEAVE